MIVESKRLQLSQPFYTENGDVIEKPIVAYEEYGQKEGHVVLALHGGLNSHHVAGKYAAEDRKSGEWDGLIGPGKAIDTNLYRVIAPNALGSMYGTSSPLTLNPDTKQPWGADFPNITFIDMAHFHKVFLEEIGVSKVFMSAGPSMGALQSLQLAALYPDLMDSVVAVASSGRMTPSGMCMHHFIMNAMRMDPDFNEGRYEIGTPKLGLRYVHQVIMIYYTHESIVRDLCWDETSQEKRSEKARNFITPHYIEEHLQTLDPNCFIRVLNALNSYDLAKGASSYEKGVQRIQCPVLMMNVDTDQEFPPYWAEEVANILNQKNPGQAEAITIRSKWGHAGCLKEMQTMGEHIKAFIKRIS
ncbi:MAG: alpha/beta fold hydrolase [SAR324 cluster bacterium]|nr:alpha/beta fold hydrolase [SAR324 cluster bacterium]